MGMKYYLVVGWFGKLLDCGFVCVKGIDYCLGYFLNGGYYCIEVFWCYVEYVV